MTFQSILFERTENNVQEVGLVAPVFFADLNLDQIVNTITNGKDEYNLKPFFYESLNDIDAITYRHEIMRELEDHKLFKYVNIFARKMSTIRDHMAQTDKLYYKWQKDAWLFHTIEIYCEAINSFANDLSTS